MILSGFWSSNQICYRTLDVEKKYYADDEDAYNMRKYFDLTGKSFESFKKKQKMLSELSSNQEESKINDTTTKKGGEAKSESTSKETKKNESTKEDGTNKEKEKTTETSTEATAKDKKD